MLFQCSKHQMILIKRKFGKDNMENETFEVISSKLQSELLDIIENNKEVNDYELIVYKYIFISELGIPLLEDFGIELEENSFILFIVPDYLEFTLLRKLDDCFDKFEISFMPNSYNIIKLKFEKK